MRGNNEHLINAKLKDAKLRFVHTERFIAKFSLISALSKCEYYIGFSDNRFLEIFTVAISEYKRCIGIPIYCSENDIAFRWVQREFNLTFTLSSDKDQTKEFAFAFAFADCK